MNDMRRVVGTVESFLKADRRGLRRDRAPIILRAQA